jgi:hypothetical protein
MIAQRVVTTMKDSTEIIFGKVNDGVEENISKRVKVLIKIYYIYWHQNIYGNHTLGLPKKQNSVVKIVIFSVCTGIPSAK